MIPRECNYLRCSSFSHTLMAFGYVMSCGIHVDSISVREGKQ